MILLSKLGKIDSGYNLGVEKDGWMETQTCTEARLEGDSGVFPISSCAFLHF